MNVRNRIILTISFFISIILIILYPYFFAFDQNLFSTLNGYDARQEKQIAISKYESRIQNKLIILVETENFDSTILSATQIYNKLLESKLFNHIYFKNIIERKKFYNFYSNHKKKLLTKNQILNINQKKFSKFENDAFNKLYSPFSFLSGDIKNDPLLLLPSFFDTLTSNQNLIPVGDYLTTTNKNPTVVILGELDNQNIKKSLRLLESIKNNSKKNTQVYFSSASFHGEKGKEQAQMESSIFSTISITFILFLFFFQFRSLDKFFITFSSIILSSTCSLYLISILIGPIHIASLILCGSVTGILVDYFIHYFFALKENKLFDNFDNIREPITWSLITTLVGFGSFYFSPIIILKQFSLFCIFSLIFTYLNLKYYLRLFRFNHNWKTTNEISPNERFMSFLIRKKRIFFLLPIIFGSIYQIYNSELKNDIRQFAKRDSTLLTQDNEIKKQLNLNSDYDFFLVKGKSKQALLENEEKLKNKIDQSKIILNPISNWVPSISKQKISQKNYKLLIPTINKMYQNLNIIKNENENENQQSTDYITLDNWFDYFKNNFINQQYIGNVNENFYSIVPIVNKFEALPDFNQYIDNDWHYINKIEILNNDINFFHKTINIYILGFIICIFIIFTYKFRIKKALLLITPPLASIIISLAIVNTIYSYLNLFNIFGAFLIFCLGLDYSFFYFFKRNKSKDAASGINFSALTTLFSFGILSFSNTHAVSSFGLTISIGIVICWVLVPISLTYSNGEKFN